MNNIINHNDIPIYKTIEVLRIIEHRINANKAFSLIRFGDGTIKAINAYYENDDESLKKISVQEGIPVNQFGRLINLWKTSANVSDFIDSPEVYFSNLFWQRTKTAKKKKISDITLQRLKAWKDLYDKIGITTIKYCNPEINFLSCIVGKYGQKCLPELLRYKKICLITSREDAGEKLSPYFKNLEVHKILGKGKNQYQNSFNKVIEKIDKQAKDFDLWLIAAGELGRVYPGLIKFQGGRALDIGSLVDYWCTGDVPSRLIPYLKTTRHHSLKLELTPEGKVYSKNI